MLKNPTEVVFEADPRVVSLFDESADYFGLGLVVGWPPDPGVIGPSHHGFVQAVRNCFQTEDLHHTPNDPPSVYLQPLASLHITVATLYPLERRKKGVKYSEIEKNYIELVRAAAKRIAPSQQDDQIQSRLHGNISTLDRAACSAYTHDMNSQLAKQPSHQGTYWPSKPLQLEIKSAQIRSKAGILLWNETTAGLEQLRACLREEASMRSLPIHNIPDIVHTTFLRFSRVPISAAGHVQETFRATVLPKLSTELFQFPIAAHSVKLVAETRPYMHIPHEDKHVLLAIDL